MMLQEIRYALRMLLRTPGFTAIATLSLALGIGANAAIFSLADALLLRPLAVTDPGKVLSVSLAIPGSPVGGLSYPDYRDLRSQTRSFSGLVANQLSTFSMAKSKNEVPQMRMGMIVSDNFFQVLGIQPTLGRSFLPEEGTAPVANPVIVLSYGFWRDQFDKDNAVLGRAVRINGIDFTIVGVAPAAFTGMDQYIRPAFYLPAAMAQRLSGAKEDPLEKRNDYSWSVDGRLAKGASQAKAQSELATLWSNLEKQYPANDRNRTMAVRTQLQARIQNSSVDALLIGMLMALVSIVLIVACANVANLLLGRARGRSREMAIRIALGVSRLRLMRQLLTENLLLSVIGALFGVGLAYGGIRFLQTIPIPTDLPVVISPQLDERVLIFSLIVSVISAVVFGLAPALQSLKTDLVPALKSADNSMAGRRRTLGRNTLVIGQIALSMILLVTTGMLLNGFRKTLLGSPGFRTDHLLLMQLDPTLVRYTPEQTKTLYRDLLARARAVPGVRSIAVTQAIPFGNNLSTRAMVPDGYQPVKGQESVGILTNVVDESYFDEMKIDIVKGRAFTSGDKADTARVAIVNQEFADQFWPGENPIGKRVHVTEGKGSWVQVVGVARNSKYMFISEPQMRYMYVPFSQDQATEMYLLVESYGDPAALASPLRDVVHSLDANQPVYNVRTFANLYQIRAVATPLIIVRIVAAMGLMGLTLALVGIYGLVSYSVARRTREIGVRIAIGASKLDVLKMVLGQGFVLALIGIVAGGIVSVAAARVVSAALIGLAQPNLATFIVVPLAVLLVTMAACWAPAWRASKVDPIRALRFE